MTRLLLVTLGVLVLAPAAAAQGLRGEVRLTGSFLQYRNWERRAVPDSLTPGTGTDQVLPDGTPVTCVPGLDCYWYAPGAVDWGTPMTQELRLMLWPGVQGLSFRAHVRSRLGSDGTWPRSADRFEVVDLHADLVQPRYRVRAGRIQRLNLLGLYFLDGATVQWRPGSVVRIEGFAGRSRARVIQQEHDGPLLAEADERAPGVAGFLWGGEAWLHGVNRVAASVTYQREERLDGPGLFSERGGASLAWRPGWATLEAAAEYDFAFAHFNDARLTVSLPVSPGLRASMTARSYRPFLELWTIWGAFSPVGYTEAQAALAWQPTRRWGFSGSAAYRRYEDTEAGAVFLPVDTEGWRVRGSAQVAEGPWSVALGAGRSTGGADRTTVDFHGRRELPGDARLGLFLVLTEGSVEYRFGKGSMWGGGLESRIGLGSVDLDLEAGRYRHTFSGQPGFGPYAQWRLRMAASWRFGTEPRASGRALQ